MQKALSVILLTFCCVTLLAQTDKETLINQLYKETDLNSRYYLNKPYPEFSAKATDGSEISSEDLKGKIVMINFWYTACPPCVAELEELNKVYEKHKDNPGFQFISITLDSDALIKAAMAKYNIRYPVYSLSKEECERLLAKGFPTNVFLDKEGTAVMIKMGGAIKKEAVVAQVEGFNTAIGKLLSVF